MFLILLTYRVPLADVDDLVSDHRAFLDRYYASGHFLLSGRKEPRTGGVILARAATREMVETIVQEDPFHQKQIAAYEILLWLHCNWASSSDPERPCRRRPRQSCGSLCSRVHTADWTTRNLSVTYPRVDAVAQALADPIRREILRMLRDQPMNAGAIASAFSVSRPAISRHLRVLREAGLVSDESLGRERGYRLTLDALAELEAFLAELRALTRWERRFMALETEVQRVKRGRRRDLQARVRRNNKDEKETA